MLTKFPTIVRLLCLIPVLVSIALLFTVGLGGLTTVVLVLAAGLVSRSIGVDRLIWVVWWILLFVFHRERIETALSSGQHVLA